jgi:hypothetical protein
MLRPRRRATRGGLALALGKRSCFAQYQQIFPWKKAKFPNLFYKKQHFNYFLQTEAKRKLNHLNLY